MSNWQTLQITGVGRPVLHKFEREILVQSKVGIYEGKYKTQGYQNGRLYLTTRRICYVDEHSARTHSICLPLSSISKIDYYGGFMRSSPKITLHLAPVAPSDADNPDSHPADIDLMATWVCPICYFSNDIVSNYFDLEANLPVCKTCGITAEKQLIVDSLRDFNNANAQLHNGKHSTSEVDGFTCPRCTFVNHPSLTSCEMCGARLTSARLPPALATATASAKVLVPSPKINESTNAAEFNVVKLSFRAGVGDKAFYEQLKQVLDEKPWASENIVQVPDTPQEGSSTPSQQNRSRGPGLYGLELVGEEARQRNQEVLGGALEDLQTLKARAQEVVHLAESYAKKLELADIKNGSQDSSTFARQALRQSSEALGLNSSIVTKEMAQSDHMFHEELARQLAEFLMNSGILYREGGALTLFDTFAYYNRARGISLISPKDLYSACGLFEKLKLPIRMRKFKKSEVYVVQEAYRTSTVVIKQILTWYTQQLAAWQQEVGVSVQDVSGKFGWSPVVAIEELEMAEDTGALCRDETVSGVRFFVNEIVPYKV